jgi:hypothetical protein
MFGEAFWILSLMIFLAVPFTIVRSTRQTKLLSLFVQVCISIESVFQVQWQIRLRNRIVTHKT